LYFPNHYITKPLSCQPTEAIFVPSAEALPDSESHRWQCEITTDTGNIKASIVSEAPSSYIAKIKEFLGSGLPPDPNAYDRAYNFKNRGQLLPFSWQL